MILIQKGNEPVSLTKYKKKQNAYFDGYSQKADIRNNLLKEQGYLCAYCMRRISDKDMKIEHWYPEDKLSDLETLDYRNMLGVCIGHKEGQRGKDDTCDTHKGNMVISVDPREAASLSKIKYRSGTGEIYSDSPEIEKDLNEILNLNSKGHHLAENRKTKLDSVICELQRKYPNGTWPKEKLQRFIREYSKPDVDGRKTEYLGIVTWYLSKKVNRV